MVPLRETWTAFDGCKQIQIITMQHLFEDITSNLHDQTHLWALKLWSVVEKETKKTLKNKLGAFKIISGLGGIV